MCAILARASALVGQAGRVKSVTLVLWATTGLAASRATASRPGPRTAIVLPVTVTSGDGVLAR